MKPIAADLMDPQALRDALVAVKPTDVFISAWKRHPTEAENIKVNAAMVRHLLDARGTRRQRPPRRTGHRPQTLSRPLRSLRQGQAAADAVPRRAAALAVENFYYAQEDEVFAAAARGLRLEHPPPVPIIGRAVGNAMNMGVTLAVYATICRATGRPFRFPGSARRGTASPT